MAIVPSEIQTLIERSASYGVAIDPETRRFFALGVKPAALVLDVNAIIDA